MADIAAVKQFAFDLTRSLPEGFYYHNWKHTLDVLHRAQYYAGLEMLSEDAARLLQTAALLHDTGFTQAYDDHEAASVHIARQTLPKFGYSEDEINTIARVITATRQPQTPQTPLGKILCDADMDNLGREDFFERSDDLRRELSAVCGQEYSDGQWRRSMLELLETHTYFTASAREQRNTGKTKNLLLWSR